MKRSEFFRIFPLRAPGLMWFTGAGTSASAGIRTAGQMIWHFKQQIYCAEHRVQVRSCPDLGDEAFRNRLNRYFQDKGGYPPVGADDEYAFYFEQAYPNERDRRAYIDDMVSGTTTSQGYLALAALAKLGKVRVLWSTNFDRLPDDAFTKVLGSTGSFAVASLDAPELAEQALSEGRRPVVIRLHGDFLSRRLKNTTDELKAQDQRLRRCLVNECRRQGLLVVGYSGRDNSAMDALEEAIDDGRGYPNGLFWFHRPDGPPADRVVRLIERARERGVDAHLIEAETFDELVVDLFLLMENVPDELLAAFDQRRPRLSMVQVPEPASNFPVIRFNALPVLSVPATCRLVECEIGGTREVREAAKKAGVSIAAMRTEAGVIAFGNDADVKSAFDGHKISRFDLYSIDSQRLDRDNSELGLLNEALARAIVRDRPLVALPGRKGWKIYVDPQQERDPRLQALRAAAGSVSGLVAGTNLKWAEAVRIRLERKLGQCWLLFEPSVWVERVDDDKDVKETAVEPLGRVVRDDAATEFIRERAAKRYNHVLNKLIDGWVEVLVGPTGTAQVSIKSLGLTDGVDASFTLSRTTAFSGRGGRP